MYYKNALSPIAVLLIAYASGGSAPALAEVSGTFNGWTATVSIEQLASGEVEGAIEFHDGGSGGTRRGGVCLVTDLGLGPCSTNEECSEKAVRRGLPGTQSPGWRHYCVAAATDEGTQGKRKRCWSRPGLQADYCTLGINPPGAVRTKARLPYGIGGLDDDARDWAPLGCVAGGTAPDGSIVGNPTACATEAVGFYLYIIDTPLEVPSRK